MLRYLPSLSNSCQAIISPITPFLSSSFAFVFQIFTKRSITDESPGHALHRTGLLSAALQYYINADDIVDSSVRLITTTPLARISDIGCPH